MKLHRLALTNYRGIPGTIYSDAYAASHRIYFETLFGQPVYGSVVIPGIGLEHFDVLRELPRLIGFGAMLLDEVDDNNRVEWNESDGKPRIHYQLSDGDRVRLRFAAQRAVEVMFAAGARSVLLELPALATPVAGTLPPAPAGASTRMQSAIQATQAAQAAQGAVPALQGGQGGQGGQGALGQCAVPGTCPSPSSALAVPQAPVMPPVPVAPSPAPDLPTPGGLPSR